METPDPSEFSARLVRGDDGIWTVPSRASVSYPEDGAALNAGVEDRSFWFRHRNACIAALVERHPPGGAIFDIGGGTGFVARGLAARGFAAVLVEPTALGARVARSHGLPVVIRATLEEAAFAPGSLPAAGLFDVVEHMEHDAAFMKSVHRVLRPGGKVYVTVPAYGALWSVEDTATGHFRRYTLGSLSSLLESAGFSVDQATYIFRWLPLPIFLLRTLPSRLGLAGAPRAQMERDHGSADGLAHRAAWRLLAPEVENIARGRAMAFGASCLAAATRR